LPAVDSLHSVKQENHWLMQFSLRLQQAFVLAHQNDIFMIVLQG